MDIEMEECPTLQQSTARLMPTGEITFGDVDDEELVRPLECKYLVARCTHAAVTVL